MTAKFQFEVSELADLLPIATPREAIAIQALLEHAHGPRAAAAAGLTMSALHQRIGCVRRRAQRGAGVPAVPGMYPRQVTTGRDGTVVAVQHRPEQIAPDEPLPPGHVISGVSQLVDGEGRELLRWTKTNRRQQDEWAAYEAAIRAVVASVPPAPPVPAPLAGDSDLLTVLPWGDPHIGALSWQQETGQSWDLALAEQQTTQVLADLITRTPRSRDFILVDLGDLFHAEDDAQRTPTAGHKLDVDSRAGKIARVALRMCRTAIDLALTRHDRVTFRALRGNHDPYKSLMLGLWLEATYAAEPRVTIAPCDNPYQFHQHGRCSFMWHHGDGSKPQQMPGIFACDDSWGSARWRYIQTGHIHSQNRWDFPGCTVESFRTVFTGDYWSHWKGYRSGRTLDAITYHAEHGEISRISQGPRG
jgi:hypothetical protein